MPFRHVHSATCGCKCASPVMRSFHRRVSADLTRRMFLGGMAAAVLPFMGFKSDSAFAQQPKVSTRPLLLTNLRLFDGITSMVQAGKNVRIEGNKVVALPAVSEAPGDVEIIDCGGRLVMPGLIDAHWHSTLCGLTQMQVMTADVPYIHLVAAHEAQRTLMRGFTTTRDAGGPSFALKRAIDEGLTHGPRIYPSGAMITQTSGHGDFRMRYEIPRADGDITVSLDFLTDPDTNLRLIMKDGRIYKSTLA